MRFPRVLRWSACAALLLLAGDGAAAVKVTLYLFYGKGCHSCLLEKEFLAGLQQRLPQLEVRQIEAQFDPANGELLLDLAARHGVEPMGVPVSFVGPFPPIVGFRDAATTGRRIEALVRECAERGCEDPVGPIVEAALAGRGAAGGAPSGAAAPAEPPDTLVTLPLLGQIELRSLSLAALTVAIGALDGFNPCAFFVLFTLLGVIVHARSRARMLLVGGTFVLCSGLLYFLFMAAWLNVFRHAGELRAVTVAAGVVALGMAAINVKDYFFFHRGITLSIPEGRKPRLFARMRGLLHETSLPAMLFGTLVLAVAANSYELLCTAGFPMVYTRILTLNELRPAAHYLYLALYNLVYVVPLATVVLVFALTLGSRKLSEEQGRVLKLVSGLMMLGLGVVLLVDPSLFNSMLAGAGLLGVALLAAASIVGATRWVEHARGRRGGPRPPALPAVHRGGLGIRGHRRPA